MSIWKTVLVKRATFFALALEPQGFWSGSSRYRVSRCDVSLSKCCIIIISVQRKVYTAISSQTYNLGLPSYHENAQDTCPSGGTISAKYLIGTGFLATIISCIVFLVGKLWTLHWVTFMPYSNKLSITI